MQIYYDTGPQLAPMICAHSSQRSRSHFWDEGKFGAEGMCRMGDGLGGQRARYRGSAFDIGSHGYRKRVG